MPQSAWPVGGDLGALLTHAMPCPVCPTCITQVSSLSAQVLALRAERDELHERCQHGTLSSSSMQSSYQEQLLALSATCRGQQQEIQQLQGQLQQCTHDKVRRGGCTSPPWHLGPCIHTRSSISAAQCSHMYPTYRAGHSQRSGS